MKMKLKELREQNGISQAKLAQWIGVSRSAVAMWERGASQPDNDTLTELADFFDVTVDYLLGRCDRKNGSNFIRFGNIFGIEKKRYPLLADIAGGEPVFADEGCECLMMTGAEADADFCIRAEGKSMTDARICDGDIVFVKQTTAVNNGETAVVVIGGELTLKRVYSYPSGYPDGKKLILTSDSSETEPLVFIGDEIENVRIIGKAVAFHSSL